MKAALSRRQRTSFHPPEVINRAEDLDGLVIIEYELVPVRTYDLDGRLVDGPNDDVQVEQFIEPENKVVKEEKAKSS